MTDAITSLIERLEGASEGSRELDAEIAVVTRWPAMGRIKHWVHEEEMETRLRGYIGFKNLKDNSQEFSSPKVTTSLDAALAMAERVLPKETFWQIGHSAVIGGRKFYNAEIYPPNVTCESGNPWGHATTPAIALVIAIIRAKHRS